ncbi:hypothetical protein CLV41_11595 [Roseibium marinum]|uniref:SLH domain-containing protein n=2 Tax=Roseibium marinum TaxID=281252 RepID=A0A2S3UKS2_9HYPH|nr:hypothetical protein CLV41_11595 [Roseibium marinum]
MKAIQTLSAVLLAKVFLCGICIDYAAAATFDDPTWPCQQRKVESLSMALMWTSQLPEGFDPQKPGTLTPQARDLAALLSLRKFSLEEAETAIREFADSDNNAEPQQMAAIFAQVFNSLGNTRRQIINGIESYSLKQIALSEKIDLTRSDMRVLMDAEKPDFDKVDALEEQLDWDERVFRDRGRSLTYVCETPVLIEKRLYALAHLLMKYAK